ncbi:hypothetical protein W97_04733 [Coniosporium apollinis CBS 100218]|uniref:Uncharacterized protein n=1 Tax=Coniosporium apollinis (strain CBS 100218) TaxID=1168221 RepID=R7YUC4_CONA1|nr:uncharacterized protein W97_04733 [Coniosporium apollinis CBS 100218]EON65495.1 hypothetical protein W97_04733 [Coniosporium apollinis CBS 100218]
MPSGATRAEVLSHQPLGSYVEETSIIKTLWSSFDASFQAYAQHVPFKVLSRLTALNVDIHHNVAREHLNAKSYPNYLDIVFAVGIAIGCQYFAQQIKASTTFRIFSRNNQLMGEMVPGEIRGDSFDVMLASQRCRTMCYHGFRAVWDENLCACVMQVEEVKHDWVPYEVEYAY